MYHEIERNLSSGDPNSIYTLTELLGQGSFGSVYKAGFPFVLSIFVSKINLFI